MCFAFFSSGSLLFSSATFASAASRRFVLGSTCSIRTWISTFCHLFEHRLVDNPVDLAVLAGKRHQSTLTATLRIAAGRDATQGSAPNQNSLLRPLPTAGLSIKQTKVFSTASTSLLYSLGFALMANDCSFSARLWPSSIFFCLWLISSSKNRQHRVQWPRMNRQKGFHNTPNVCSTGLNQVKNRCSFNIIKFFVNQNSGSILFETNNQKSYIVNPVVNIIVQVLNFSAFILTDFLIVTLMITSKIIFI